MEQCNKGMVNRHTSHYTIPLAPESRHSVTSFTTSSATGLQRVTSKYLLKYGLEIFKGLQCFIVFLFVWLLFFLQVLVQNLKFMEIECIKPNVNLNWCVFGSMSPLLFIDLNKILKKIEGTF